ncbi:MAG TPA: hypothetical protein DGG94_15135 [Micromonosporaceae bacterium]|nr:hypothetical protein [Micromonosporaceae bacterium]HCU51105.1 hypothetical protein [Micromonosporaceae bacterium]
MRFMTGTATLVTSVAASLGVGVVVADVPPPYPRKITGNITNCRQAGLSGGVLFGSKGYPANGAVGGATTSKDGRSVTVVIKPGHSATAIVVKSGPHAYVYRGFYVGPLASEKRAESGISHWFVCSTSVLPRSG